MIHNKKVTQFLLTDGTICSALPFAENLKKIQVDENFIFCEKSVQPDRKAVRSWWDNDKKLLPMVKENFTALYDKMFQETVFICKDGSTVELDANKKYCHFTTLKLNADKTLPLCDHQNSGLNLNGKVDIDANLLSEKLRNKQLFWVYGDSTSRNLAFTSSRVLKKRINTSRFFLGNFSRCLPDDTSSEQEL